MDVRVSQGIVACQLCRQPRGRRNPMQSPLREKQYCLRAACSMSAVSIVLGGTTIHNSMTFLTDLAQLGARALGPSCKSSKILQKPRNFESVSRFAEDLSLLSSCPQQDPRRAASSERCPTAHVCQEDLLIPPMFCFVFSKP